MLNHPNVLAIYAVGNEKGPPYLVSELLEGETLRERLREGGLGVRKAIDYAVQAAQGLAAAHDKGITHRDLKPGNIFLTQDGRIKILDFGLAKLTHPEVSTDARTVTQQGAVLGTVGYMSPEQVRGRRRTTVPISFPLGRRCMRCSAAASVRRRVGSGDDERDSKGGAGGSGVAAAAGSARGAAVSGEDRRGRVQSARDLAFVLEGARGSSLWTDRPRGRSRACRRSISRPSEAWMGSRCSSSAAVECRPERVR
jgi:serine/threonine protein kinase